MTRLRLTHVGPHVTWQDAGRPGLLRFGVPASGPMDRGAFALARAAVRTTGPVLEISPGGLALECLTGAVSLALAGGGFVVERQGRAWRGGSWCRLTLQAGDRLVVRPGFWGNWTYLAFAAPVEVAGWLGSQATHGPSGLGGGRPEADLTLPEAALWPEGPLPCPVWARPLGQVRATRGPQDRFFAPEVLATFFAARFSPSPAFDRMGLRLQGPVLPPEGALAIPSEPILRGSVQVNGAGVASVLMADHQTTGGYPKIATVVDADLDGLAQLRPGQALRFAEVSPEAAAELTRARRARVAKSVESYLSGHSN